MMSITAYPTRSPPDGKSPPPPMADASVVIPGFLSQSRELALAVPLPAPVLLSKTNSTQSSPCKSMGRTIPPIQKPKQKSSECLQSEKTKENIQPSAWRASLPNASYFAHHGQSAPYFEFLHSATSPPSALESPKPAPRTKINGRVTATPKPAPRFSSRRFTSQPQDEKHPIPDSRPVASPRQRVFIATPVSSTIHKSGTPIHISQKCPQTSHLVLSQRTLQADPVQSETLSSTYSAKPENLSTELDKRCSSEIAPYFIQPLNLCDPFLDNLGLAEICSLRVDELQYLTHTNHNKPVTLRDGRTKPSFMVRIWSRGSGKYLDLLSVGELYGRGMFGKSGAFRLILNGPRTVMLQSARDPDLHVAMDHWTVTGNGTGGRECQFLIHQGPTGYCLLESLHSPGSFLGVRANGNILRPASVNYNSPEARFGNNLPNSPRIQQNSIIILSIGRDNVRVRGGNGSATIFSSTEFKFVNRVSYFSIRRLKRCFSLNKSYS